jgi:hypothetical protein
MPPTIHPSEDGPSQQKVGYQPVNGLVCDTHCCLVAVMDILEKVMSQL